MHETHEFLKVLAVVLCVAAVTTVVFQRLRQPVVLGYIIAGLIIGPHVPIPLVADTKIVHTLSEIGVILLMFALGLEFRLKKLVALGPTAGVTGLIQCTLMFWLGFIVGQAFGWTTLESLFTGAIIAISSTTIIAKVFDEQKVRGRLRELVVGILIVEDLVAILLLAMLTAISTGAGLSATDVAVTIGELAAFLIALVVVGIVLVPRAMPLIVRLNRPETTLVASIGICFAFALLALSFGYSVALGAFLAGMLIAESGEEKAVEPLVLPVKDLFAAIFFVSVGMMIDPRLVLEHWPAVLVLTGVVIVGKLVGVALGLFLTGSSTRTAVQSGLSLAQIGEFSFIIAGLGLSLGSTRPFLYPVAVTVSAITTLTTPWLIRFSGPFASYVDRKLPRPLQTFISLYGSWVDTLKRPGRAAATGHPIRRLFRALIVDAVLLTVIAVGTAVLQPQLSEQFQSAFGLALEVARIAVVAVGVAFAAPFCIGIVRVARKLGVCLAENALPDARKGRPDLAAAPRRALVVTLQAACILLVGIPMLAITQPFLPPLMGPAVLLGLLAVLAVSFWRGAANLHGHVRAGAEVVLEALSSHSRATAHRPSESGAAADLSAVRQLLPGIGEPVSLTLGADSPALGRSLAQLNLRGVTGATVLAIQRSGAGVLVPSASEVLREGDVLALAGSTEAIAAARSLLLSGPPGRTSLSGVEAC